MIFPSIPICVGINTIAGLKIAADLTFPAAFSAFILSPLIPIHI
jgi:hypothetical protein